MDTVANLLRMPKYYLDTVAVRKLATILSEGEHESLLTSVFTFVELIGNIKDENTFHRQKSIIAKLANGKFQIDPFLPMEVQLEAFNIPFKSDVSNQILELMTRLVRFDTYHNWRSYEESLEPHPNVYEYIQIVDKQKTFAQMLKMNWSDDTIKAIAKFNDIWDANKSRDEVLTQIINYYLTKYRVDFSKYADDIRYKNSINLFMLVHAHFVGKKVSRHDHPGRNDFLDLMHLLYVRNGMTLVTDDRRLLKSVNEVWDNRAITVEEFLKQYK